MKYELVKNSKIGIGKSSIGGRGVFAKENIQEGEILEEAHFIICGSEPIARDKELKRYCFTLFYDKNLTPSENQELNFKISLATFIADEDLQKSIMADLKELNYEDPSKVWSSAAVLGYGMIYNHSDSEYNANWEIDFHDFLFRYKSIKSIQKGEEIFINYGNNEREDLQ